MKIQNSQIYYLEISQKAINFPKNQKRDEIEFYKFY